MQASKRLVEICWALYERNKHLAHGNDDQRRELNMMICQQVKHELSSTMGEFGYGTKSATPTNPLSKDSIAFRASKFGTLWSIDWQNGTTREPQIVEGSEFENITGQHYVSVTPHDYLGVVVVPPVEPPVEPIPPSTIDAKLNSIIAIQNDLVQSIRRIEEKLDELEINFPDYEGRQSGWAGGNIKLTPKKS